MIYLGSDHRGFNLKEKIKVFLTSQKLPFEDLGNKILDPEDDYPDFAKLVVEKVSESLENFGILFCGSGAGVDIVANRRKGIRSVLGFDVKQVSQARKDDHVNVLSLASDFIDEEKAEDLILSFLNTPFSQEEKHQRRIEKIDA